MKKVYICMGIMIGLCVVMSILLSFSYKAMPTIQPGYQHFFNTGNVWYNIVNIAFLAIAACAVVVMPLTIIIVRTSKSIKERREIKKADKIRDERIKEELRLIREREAAENIDKQE